MLLKSWGRFMRLNLMARYPTAARGSFLKRREVLTDDEVNISKEFGREYFDGDRKFGLGGYHYDPKFFTPVVEDFIKYYGIQSGDRILDIGCAKGFMLYDFTRLVPGISVSGIDVSKYCMEQAISPMKPFIVEGSCDELPYPDNSFDFVFSIATIHNLDERGIEKSLREIVRVTKKGAFIKVNGYSNDEERERINGWNIVASKPLAVEKWIDLFAKTGYQYDFDFFVP